MASFKESIFEDKLLTLKDSQDSIGSLSSWCLTNKAHHEKIVSVWLNVMKKVKIEHRLVLFYLANDVIQYSRRKSLPFVESFIPALQKATKLVREDSVRNKILRLFNIWSERGIYEEQFLVELSNMLNRGYKNSKDADEEFQSSTLYSKIRKCKDLEEDTDKKLNVLNKNHVSFTDIERYRKTLKDREHGDELLFEFDGGVASMKAYVKALENELTERLGLIDLLEIAEEFYEKEYHEAKVVVNAYKCFATRVKGVKRKLDEQVETMQSPVSIPDIYAPSPSPEMNDDKSSPNAADEVYKPSNYFPSNEIRKQADNIAPYVPEAYFEAKHAQMTEGDKHNNTYPPNNDEQNSLSFEGLSESILNSTFLLDQSITTQLAAITNSTPNVKAEKIQSETQQQLSLSALLQTLMPAGGSNNSSLVTTENQNLTYIGPRPDTVDLTESPESPPMFEKVNYPSLADQSLSQDIDMRFASDVDDRAIQDSSQSWVSSDIDFRTRAKSENNPHSQNQDNVENIDMEMSDDEEKLNRSKDSDDLATSYDGNNDITDDSFLSTKSDDMVASQMMYTEVAPPPPPMCVNTPFNNIVQFNNSNGSNYKNSHPPIMSGKGDGPNVDFALDKFPKLPLPPPPPPPPPPPHPSQMWSPTFSAPPPPQFDASQMMSQQQALYFAQPPPPPTPPVMPVQHIPMLNRPYNRTPFRNFQRPPPRFPRW